MFRIQLIPDIDHIGALRLSEESLETANEIMQTKVNALLHEAEDAPQLVGVKQITQQEAKVVRSLGLLMHDIALVLFLVIQR